ncbi:hypothetical protein LCI18_006359 [Fusarium solani-melongenae]|uniref:Uncharacterized protein n=1 Tax=Fusarium solani subsp. cucurbitae TaxID=2747967 RepID=A0ACD3Z2E1_FUSSC|nr:hypothetical protein LCI18_006359 [Fusarium solani-melongenae]
MKTLAQRCPESGVQSVTGLEIMEYVPEDKVHLKTGDIYACEEGDEFRVLGPQELSPGGLWGCEYQTWIVNIHIYCRWLLARFVRQGGNLVQMRLSSLDEAFDLMPSSGSAKLLVVNCSGRNFDTDPRCNVIRGQAVLVKNAHHKTATRHKNDGSWSFLIPRPLGGGTIVGGMKQMGDWGSEIRPEETKAILEAAVRCWPEFVSKVEDFEVVAVNVVVHGYGAGARGYELSWGVAERIVSLVGREIGEVAKL